MKGPTTAAHPSMMVEPRREKAEAVFQSMVDSHDRCCGFVGFGTMQDCNFAGDLPLVEHGTMVENQTLVRASAVPYGLWSSEMGPKIVSFSFFFVLKVLEPTKSNENGISLF